nr:helix-turn-helix domain protein [uncultured bacterium]
MQDSPNILEDSGKSSDRADRTTEFVGLWTETGRRIYSYILSLLPNVHDAEEVFSEVSKVLWEKFDEYRPGTNFRAWATRIAYFKILRYLDDRKRQPTPIDADFFKTINRIVNEQSAALEAQYRALADCVNHLKPRDRQLLASRYAEGATTQGVAQTLGRSVDAIYKSLARIRSILFDCITARLAEEER